MGFIAGWPSDDRARFAEGFSQALAAALRQNDPTPALGYLKVMATRRPNIDRPSAPWNPEEHEALLPERIRRAPAGTPTS